MLLHDFFGSLWSLVSKVSVSCLQDLTIQAAWHCQELFHMAIIVMQVPR